MLTALEVNKHYEQQRDERRDREARTNGILFRFIEGLDDMLSDGGRQGLTAGDLIELMRAISKRRAAQLATYPTAEPFGAGRE